jgi:hypothetical protein
MPVFVLLVVSMVFLLFMAEQRQRRTTECPPWHQCNGTTLTNHVDCKCWDRH